eukprot:scaffold18295_cov78-Skeletonema_dohrnii-CCMP3373.AAC.1
MARCITITQFFGTASLGTAFLATDWARGVRWKAKSNARVGTDIGGYFRTLVGKFAVQLKLNTQLATA